MLIDERFRFALDSLKKCVLMEPKNNFFFSPYLIYQNLLVIYFATRDSDIEKSLQQILYIPRIVTKDGLKKYYKDEGIKQFCYVMHEPENSYVYCIFSRIYMSKCKYQLLKRKTLSLFSFGYPAIKSCDVESDPDGIRVFINSNISCVTQNKILNLLPPNSIDSKTDVVLANAIYLKGQLPNCEHDGTFDGSKCEIKNDNQSADKDKEEKSTVFITEIPIKQNAISMFFICLTHPKKPRTVGKSTEKEKDIIKLMEYFTTKKGSLKLHNLLNKESRKQTRMLSTFKIEHNLRIKELLEMVGIPELTPSGRAELPAFTREGFLTLGNAVHQASIEMTENSITATASNAFFSVNSDCQHVQTTNIPADIHFPCICLIYDKIYHNILFCGVLWNSDQSKMI